jgi:hypothetical protein
MYVNHLIESNAVMDQQLQDLREDLRQMREGMTVRNEIVKENGRRHNDVVAGLNKTIEDLRNVETDTCYDSAIPATAADILRSLPVEGLPSMPDRPANPDAANPVPGSTILPDLQGSGGYYSQIQRSLAAMQF